MMYKSDIDDRVSELYENYLAVETIPFHSDKFSVGSDKIVQMYMDTVCYKNYIDRLIEVILNYSDKDAWIICNGKSSVDLFIKLIESNFSFGKLEKIEGNVKGADYSFFSWNSRKVILIHKQYGSKPSWINSTIKLVSSAKNRTQLNNFMKTC